MGTLPLRTLTLDQAKREANASFRPAKTVNDNIVLMLGTSMVTIKAGIAIEDVRKNPDKYQICEFEDATQSGGVSRCLTNAGGVEYLQEEAF